jgi:hypothetical protein
MIDVLFIGSAPAHCPNATNFPILRAHSYLSSSVVRDFNLRTSTKRGLHVGTYDGFARVRVSPDLHLFT